MKALLLVLLASPAGAYGWRYPVLAQPSPWEAKITPSAELLSLKGDQAAMTGGGAVVEFGGYPRWWGLASAYYLDGTALGLSARQTGFNGVVGAHWDWARAGLLVAGTTLRLSGAPSGVPRDSVAIVFGLPLTASGSMPVGEDWSLGAVLGVTPLFAGFSSISGTNVNDVNTIDPTLVFPLTAGFLYMPWELSLEAGVQHLVGFAENTEHTTVSARLGWRFR